jgi:mono/diheme cytochrome c family protein
MPITTRVARKLQRRLRSHDSAEQHKPMHPGQAIDGTGNHIGSRIARCVGVGVPAAICFIAALVLFWWMTPTAWASPDAAVLYHNYCSVCHGDNGDGKSRASASLSTLPRDFTSDAARKALNPDRIADAIANGRPGTAMVGWKTQLSGADIRKLADHVYTRFVQGQGGAQGAPISGARAHGGREADAVSTSVPLDMTAGLPNGLKGDVKRGGAFYNANCATCHGSSGDGAGPRAYFINPKPRNFVEQASRTRLNRSALYAAISEGRLGSEMPAWKQVAGPQQIADVAEYVFQAFIRPAGAGAATPVPTAGTKP